MAQNDLISRMRKCDYIDESAIAIVKKNTKNDEHVFVYDTLVDELEDANRKLQEFGINCTITIEGSMDYDEFEVYINHNLYANELIRAADVIDEIWSAVGFAIRKNR